MRVVIADAFPQDHVGRLEAAGHAVSHVPGRSADDLAADPGDVEVLVVRSTRVTADVFERAGALRWVIRAGAGTDTIDVEAATRHGVPVSNVPGRNSVAVAELTFALLLAIDRDIPEQVADLRAGRWRKAHHQGATGIAGRRVGIVGLGDIGLAFAERARAFGCELFALVRDDRSQRVLDRIADLGITLLDDLHELARTCDVLSFHIPMSDDTRGLIGRPLLEHVREGAILLNTSRGDLVDEPALLAVLDEKQLRVGLDVYPDEPAGGEATFDSPLARHPRVVGTHHVGASTQQAQQAVADGVVDMIEAFERGEVRHCVNRDATEATG
jgi:D-3-phosphoglycerate dehydrogenase / 2-oxoglutarate reductase